VHTTARGDGPVNALDKAFRAALTKSYPGIAQVQLVDYKVRILESKTGTPPRPASLLSPPTARTSGARWASRQIIEASWEALVDSVEYKLFKDEQKK